MKKILMIGLIFNFVCAQVVTNIISGINYILPLEEEIAAKSVKSYNAYFLNNLLPGFSEDKMFDGNPYTYTRFKLNNTAYHYSSDNPADLPQPVEIRMDFPSSKKLRNVIIRIGLDADGEIMTGNNDIFEWGTYFIGKMKIYGVSGGSLVELNSMYYGENSPVQFVDHPYFGNVTTTNYGSGANFGYVQCYADNDEHKPLGPKLKWYESNSKYVDRYYRDDMTFYYFELAGAQTNMSFNGIVIKIFRHLGEEGISIAEIEINESESVTYVPRAELLPVSHSLTQSNYLQKIECDFTGSASHNVSLYFSSDDGLTWFSPGVQYSSGSRDIYSFTGTKYFTSMDSIQVKAVMRTSDPATTPIINSITVYETPDGTVPTVVDKLSCNVMSTEQVDFEYIAAEDQSGISGYRIYFTNHFAPSGVTPAGSIFIPESSLNQAVMINGEPVQSFAVAFSSFVNMSNAVKMRIAAVDGSGNEGSLSGEVIPSFIMTPSEAAVGYQNWVYVQAPSFAVSEETIFHLLPSSYKGTTVEKADLMQTGICLDAVKIENENGNALYFERPVSVLWSYPDSITNENALGVYGWAGDSWEYLGGVADTGENIIQVRVMGVSELGLFETSLERNGASFKLEWNKRLLYADGNNSLTMNILFEEEQENVRIDVYSIEGQKVRQLLNGETVKAVSLMWDGAGEDGSPLPVGPYFYKISTEGYSTLRHFLIYQ
jgi:hypothetical protein